MALRPDPPEEPMRVLPREARQFPGISVTGDRVLQVAGTFDASRDSRSDLLR
jgi:hypothetical protein